MKISMFICVAVTTYTVVTATGTVDEVTAEATKEIVKNARQISSLFQEISKLQNRFHPIEKQIRGESKQITNETTEKNQETFKLINNIDKPDCRVKAKKSLEASLTETKTSILDCQQNTAHKINEFEHDLKETHKSLKKLKKTNGKIVKTCYHSTNQLPEELHPCFRDQDNAVKVELQEYEDRVSDIKDKMADIHEDTVIQCIQATSSAFNQKTDQIIVDVKKCGNVE